MAKVVTMGEIMLRLSTPNFERFLQADEFDVCYGGGEANVAVSLANYGHNAEFITKVPENPIGDCAVAALRKMNVETKNIARGGERLGIYFLESGAAMRALFMTEHIPPLQRQRQQILTLTRFLTAATGFTSRELHRQSPTPRQSLPKLLLRRQRKKALRFHAT